MKTKVCTKCRQIKNLRKFRLVLKRGKHTRRSVCQECEKQKAKEYYKKNRKTILSKLKERTLLNREAHLIRRREYRKDNIEKIRRQSRKQYKKFTYKKRQYAKNYYRKNRDRIRRNQQEIRLKLLDFFGGKCTNCSFQDSRALQLDHINGDGYKDRHTQSRNPRDLYKWVMQNPEKARKKYQILCASCNQIKKIENQEY